MHAIHLNFMDLMKPKTLLVYFEQTKNAHRRVVHVASLTCVYNRKKKKNGTIIQ